MIFLLIFKKGEKMWNIKTYIFLYFLICFYWK